MRILKSLVAYPAAVLGLFSGLVGLASAQPCPITFSPNPGSATVTIESYWQINGYASPLNPALFKDTVTAGNATVPAGTYLGWCIDTIDGIDNGPEGYNVLMFSSCDPNLDAELANLGYTYHFTYPPTDTNTSAAQWNQLNYILNHPLAGASYWDEQAAIWNIVGGPLPPNSFYHSNYSSTLTYNTNNVAAMVNAALANAGSWSPQCGDVMAVILAITVPDKQFNPPDFPVQLTIIQVPVPCTPCISVSKQVACYQGGTNCGSFGSMAEGFVGDLPGAGVNNNPAFCYEITITNCGFTPLTNVTVSDNLLGDLTSQFFASPTNVFEPGASATAYFTMSFATNATNTVLVQGEADLAASVTNGTEVISNGMPVSATAMATALVSPAGLSCSLTLYSPLDLDGNTNDSDVLLPSASYFSTPPSISFAIEVCNTGSSPLTGVSLNAPALQALGLTIPPAFNLAPGACSNFALGSAVLTCASQTFFSVNSTGTVQSDGTHCGIINLAGNPISASSSCVGTVECSTNTTGGCVGGVASIFGTVVINCVGSTSLAGDAPLAGVTIVLYGADNNPLATNSTDVHGNYTFGNLAAGTYVIVVQPPANFIETYPVGVSNGEVTQVVVACQNAEVDFGYANTIPPSMTTNGIAGCYTTLAAADAAAKAATTGTAFDGSAATLTVGDNGQFCPATITVTGTDACGLTSNVTFTVNILTGLPQLTGVPANTNVTCAGDIPVAPVVTAKDSCGAVLTVATNQTQSNPGSTCSNVITRTWTATDCAGQTVSGTQVITQVNNTLPTANKGSIGTCYTSLAAADAAGLAATTSGTVGCAGSLNFSVSDNGQFCPATITVTGTDGCGNVVTVTYTATIITAPPTLTAVPANTTVSCASLIPVAPVVTAKDSCGTLLTVTTNQTQSNPGSTCSNVITRTWSAIDCAGQTVSGTQIITQVNTTLPTANKGTIATCFTSLATADAAALAATTSGTVGCAGSLTFTVSDNGQTCPATITVTGTDGCGNTVKVIYTATVLTGLPKLTGVPANTKVQCAGQIPPAPTVTAVDSCGTSLTVTPSQTQSNPGSTCSNVITRKWSATDCAGQTVTGTQVITQYNNTLPTANKGSIATCYTSLAAADAAALAATTAGTAGCAGSITFTVSDNGQTCPATITVKGTDGCGNTVLVTYTATILNTLPQLTGVPANTTISCSAQIPAAPAVTAKDSCGNALTVTTNQIVSNPGSTCSNLITRTWSATDCAGQTVVGTQVITQYNNAALTLACPPAVTIVTNICQMYCTFSPGDWGGSCNGGGYYNNNWWNNYCGNNSTSQCYSSFTNWWGNCGANTSQCTNWWNNWNNCHPTNWWGCWSGGQSGNWSSGWNWNNGNNEGGYGNYGSQHWVPCGGNNPDTILNNCFKQVYSNGCVTVGNPGNGKCATFTSCSSVQTCLNWNGNPGVLNNCYTNPSSAGAGSFCAQVLALKLNCDFGDYGCAPGFVGKCGDLVLCDPTSPCKGYKVRDILGACNTALGGGPCPQGCTVQYLCGLCSNLNGCFEGCQVSKWCKTNLCSVYIPTPAQTGTATAGDPCSPNPTVTYKDTVSPQTNGTYVIDRAWTAVDACGNMDTCTQIITVTTSMTNSMTNCCQTNQICGNFNSQNPNGGYLWCNAHINCNPGKPCTIYCKNASVTLTCNDGRTYTYPVPDCSVKFTNCNSGSCEFDGSKWNTTVPCAGDDEIFLSGCGIPWKSDFANCKNVCWTGTFCCDTAGVNCNWQWSGACYNNNNFGNCGSVSVKPCHNVSCGYPNGDHAGTPENCKNSCQGGACGGGGGNYTGSWSGTGSCSFTGH